VSVTARLPVRNGALNDLALADLTQGRSERVYRMIEGQRGHGLVTVEFVGRRLRSK
jgi:hypothetical protein